jgi:peptidyl-tRNA hydrolase, PTH1 family
MRLVVGLGNPGERYRRTRHNVGFMVVDALAARAAGGVRFGAPNSSQEAVVAPAHLGGEDVLLAKPLTFMNRSGVAVERLLAQHAITPADIVVLVDDVALDLGMLRVRERGSHGGQNGLRSLIEVLGTEEFVRVRLGIGRGDLTGDLADYVLADFPSDEVLVVQELVGAAADAVECLIREGVPAAMNRFNGLRPASA